MRNMLIIMLRELRLRLRKPAFWLSSLLVPVALTVLYALPVAASMHKADARRIVVVDETGLFAPRLSSTDELRFRRAATLAEAERERTDDDLLLYIPLRQTAMPRDAYLYYHGTAPSPAVQNSVDSRLQALLHDAILEDVYGLDPDTYRSVRGVGVRLHTQEAAAGHDSHLRVRRTVGLALGLLMALALIGFGMQAMRSVQAERQNRVAELMLTSQGPQQLLWGKMASVGVAAVLQLVLWISLTAAAIGGVQAAAPDIFAQARAQQQALSVATRGAEATAQYATPVALVDDTVQGLAAIDLPLTAAVFVLLFLLALPLYGSLLAAVAARLDADADALQWAIIVCSPLLLAMAMAAFGPMGAGWMLCPLTAPVAAMVQLPFGVPTWQLAVAAAGIAIVAAAAAWIAARTYRRHII